MFAYRDEALSILQEFNNPEVQQGLEELVRFTTDRKF
jgi:octaprenyl-diphosphate synthase